MDRLVGVLKIFAAAGRADDGRPNLRALSEESGVAYELLSPGYSSRRRPESIRRISDAAAGLLNLDAARLRAWIEGGTDHQMQEMIEVLSDKAQCTECGAFLERDQICRTLRKCPRCKRSAGINAWISEVDQKIASAPAPLRRAWSAAKAQPAAITHRLLARLLGLSEEDFRTRWAAEGLPLRPAGRPRRGNVVDIRSTCRRT
jgi:phage FluMu protein Com